MAREVIRVPERGRAHPTPSAWKRLSAQPAFWDLVQRGVVRVTQTGKGRTRLDGSCYVGRVAFSDVLLELHPKVSGALEALFVHATSDAFRVHPAPAPASELGALAALLFGQFVDVARTYASRGRERYYARERSQGTLVGGRLDLTATIKLRARGLRHLAAFDRNVIKFDTPVNRVAYVALGEVERLGRLIKLRPADVSRARGLALLFSDCRSAETLFGTRDSFLRDAVRLSELEDGSSIKRDLLSLAAVVLAHESFEPSSEEDRTVPRTWLLNLENLFQNAVRKLLRRLAKPLRVEAGSWTAPPIFPKESERYTANPDLVLKPSSETVVAVGDVKYKEWTGTAEAGDLYQLLAHASAFACARAFLVYPHDSFAIVNLGKSTGGCQTWLVAVSVHNLAGDLAKLLDTIGVMPPTEVTQA